MRRWIFLGLAPAALLALAACAKGAEPTPPPPLARGAQLYAASCAHCHEADAQGTQLGPSLPGLAAEAVKRQTRAPLGIMPAFPASAISDADLTELANYIAGL